MSNGFKRVIIPFILINTLMKAFCKLYETPYELRACTAQTTIPHAIKPAI
jgi:hypothetical protein